MKKFLKLCAVFTLVGALFAGCISNDIPETIKDIQRAKTDLLKAQTALINAQAIVEAGRLQEVLANAKRIEQDAELYRQHAAFRAQEAEALRIENEVQRAAMMARIAAEIAFWNLQTQEYLTALEEERIATMEAHFDYLNALMDLQVELIENKIDALDDLLASLRRLYIERAGLEDFLGAERARRVIYLTVDVPRIEAQLQYDLEYAKFRLIYWEYMFNVWTNVKDMTLDQYANYAATLDNDIEETFQKSLTARLKADKENFNLAVLIKNRAEAINAYYFGGLHDVSFDNVFSTAADDYFRTVVGVEVAQGLDLATGAAKTVDIFTGVVNNSYSLYAAGELFGTKALLGTKNTMEQLVRDSMFIVRNRVINTIEGWANADMELDDHEYYKNLYTNRYQAAYNRWKANYPIVSGGPNWNQERVDYDAALTAYKNLYGVTAADYLRAYDWVRLGNRPLVMGVTTRTVDNDMAFTTWNAFLTLLRTATNGEVSVSPTNYENALSMVAAVDPNAVRDMMAIFPVNFLYYVQKQLIERYMVVLNEVITGTHNGWNYATSELSPILGGIWLNSEALLNLVWGSTNTETVKKIINTIRGIAVAHDIMTGISAVMPAFYQQAATFLGPRVYGQGPPMQQYNPNSALEYHLWFLIYYLFGDRAPMSIGSGILSIGDGYAAGVTVNQRIFGDFLGAYALNYPGIYSYKSNPSMGDANNPGSRATVYSYYSRANTTRTVPDNAYNMIGLASRVLGNGSNRLSDLFNINEWHQTTRHTGATQWAPIGNLSNPIFSNLVSTENALRIKYLNWGMAWENLKDDDYALYYPYHREWDVIDQSAYTTARWLAAAFTVNAGDTWRQGNGLYLSTANPLPMINNADGVPVPPWIAHQVGTSPHLTGAQGGWRLIIDYYNSDPDTFAFMPEKQNASLYPSLVNGVDIYWTRGDYIPYEFTHFADPLLTPPALSPTGSWDFAFYPAIAGNRAWFTLPNWNRWLSSGLPVYHDQWLGANPVLWETFTAGNPYHTPGGPITLENAAFNRLSLVPAAFTATRKYDQYKFWYDENKDGRYQDLLDKITEEIAKLRPVVEELYQNMVVAHQLVTYKEYEILALEHEADMYLLLSNALKDAFYALDRSTNNFMWGFNNYYDEAFKNYHDWKAKVGVCEENIKTFEALGIHYVDPLNYLDAWHVAGDFTRDLVKEIDANIKWAEQRIALIDKEIVMLEQTKDFILTNIISNYK